MSIIRILQSNLNKLQTAFENQDKSSGTRLVVDILLDCNPHAKDIQAAKQKLIIKLFNDTKDYLANLINKLIVIILSNLYNS